MFHRPHALPSLSKTTRKPSAAACNVLLCLVFGLPLPAVYRICSLQKPAAVAPVHAVVFLLVLLTQLFGYTVPGSALVMIVLLALANAAKVVINAAGLMEGKVPLSTPLDIDNATIDRTFDNAKLQVVKHLTTMRRVLCMDDIVLSVRTVAVIMIAASADWMLCVPVLAFFWIVAIGLCVADTQARDMVRWSGCSVLHVRAHRARIVATLGYLKSAVSPSRRAVGSNDLACPGTPLWRRLPRRGCVARAALPLQFASRVAALDRCRRWISFARRQLSPPLPRASRRCASRWPRPARPCCRPRPLPSPAVWQCLW